MPSILEQRRHVEVGDAGRRVGDDLGAGPVGAHAEQVLALELQQIGDLAQDARDTRVLHGPESIAPRRRRCALRAIRRWRPHACAARMTPMSRRDIRAHVGELLISGFDGLTLPSEMREIAGEFDLGGLIIFSRNVEAPAQVAELALAAESLRKETPLWFSVDQEGGRVQRLKEPFTRWPPMMTLGRAKDAGSPRASPRRWPPSCSPSASRSTSRPSSTS